MNQATALSSPTHVLEAAVSAVVGDMGYELLLLEWLGAGSRRVMRLYLDSPNGITVADCSRMSRIVGIALDAAEAAAAAGEGDPALGALLNRPYTLEVSSPGVDRPLVRRGHFEQYVGSKLRVETLEPLDDTDAPPVPGSPNDGRKRFSGRIVAVLDDEAHPDATDSAIIVVADDDSPRTLHVPLTRIRRANLVWEG